MTPDKGSLRAVAATPEAFRPPPRPRLERWVLYILPASGGWVRSGEDFNAVRFAKLQARTVLRQGAREVRIFRVYHRGGA